MGAVYSENSLKILMKPPSEWQSVAFGTKIGSDSTERLISIFGILLIKRISTFCPSSICCEGEGLAIVNKGSGITNNNLWFTLVEDC